MSQATASVFLSCLVKAAFPMSFASARHPSRCRPSWWCLSFAHSLGPSCYQSSPVERGLLWSVLCTERRMSRRQSDFAHKQWTHSYQTDLPKSACTAACWQASQAPLAATCSGDKLISPEDMSSQCWDCAQRLPHNLEGIQRQRPFLQSHLPGSGAATLTFRHFQEKPSIPGKSRS